MSDACYMTGIYMSLSFSIIFCTVSSCTWSARSNWSLDVDHRWETPAASVFPKYFRHKLTIGRVQRPWKVFPIATYFLVDVYYAFSMAAPELFLILKFAKIFSTTTYRLKALCWLHHSFVNKLDALVAITKWNV